MRNLFIVSCLVLAQVALSQDRTNYIYDYAQIAVQEMEHSGIPASITLAQGILESGNGKSELARLSNNHFGIKCHKGWNGESVSYDDDAKGECFRKYKDPAESFRDHSEFLTSRSRYSELFTYSKFDYKSWARGLKKAGYATNPAYANLLIRIIEEEQLYSFDYMRPQEVAPYIASLKRDRSPNGVQVATKPRTTSNPVTTSPPSKVLAPTPKPDELTRTIFSQNNSNAVWARKGDSPEKLAMMYGISLSKLKKYNEWDKYLNEFEAGMKVYLQPKRSKSQDRASLFHTVKDGETMYQIAQHYGIKTDKLYKLNKLVGGLQPAPGEIIHLRKKRKIAPKTAATYQAAKPEPAPVTKPEPPVQEEVVVPVKEETKPVAPPVEQPKQVVMQPAEQAPAPPAPKPAPAPISEQQTSQRAVIYDPPPPVNQSPPPVYTPPAEKPKTYSGNTTVIETNPAPGSNSPPSRPLTSSGAKQHAVVKGDTLYGISRKYGVTVEQLKQWNGLTSNTIKIGQVLVVQN